MTRIEALFGGILGLAIIAALAFTMLKSGVSGGGQTGGSSTVSTIEEAGEAPIFVGDLKTDICTCYEKAFSRGMAMSSADLQSVSYKSGYSVCREAASVQGGNAWTEGWLLGSQGKLAQRSCRLYVAGLDLD